MASLKLKDIKKIYPNTEKKKSKKQNKTKEKLHSQNCGCGVFYFYSGYNSRPAD